MSIAWPYVLARRSITVRFSSWRVVPGDTTMGLYTRAEAYPTLPSNLYTTHSPRGIANKAGTVVPHYRRGPCHFKLSISHIPHPKEAKFTTHCLISLPCITTRLQKGTSSPNFQDFAHNFTKRTQTRTFSKSSPPGLCLFCSLTILHGAHKPFERPFRKGQRSQYPSHPHTPKPFFSLSVPL